MKEIQWGQLIGETSLMIIIFFIIDYFWKESDPSWTYPFMKGLIAGVIIILIRIFNRRLNKK